MTKKKQPWGIVLNTLVLVVVGILMILGAIAIFAFSSVVQSYFVSVPLLSYFSAIAFLVLIFGIIELVLAWGLWNHEAWAWWILTIIGALGILSDVFGFLATGSISILGTIFAVILFLGLLHHKTIKAVEPSIDWKGWG